MDLEFNAGEMPSGGFSTEEACCMLGVKKSLASFTVVSEGSKKDPLALRVGRIARGTVGFTYKDICENFTPEEIEAFMVEGRRRLMSTGLRSEQVIDPKMWVSVSEFGGMTSRLVCHPHMHLAFQKMVESFERTSDTLVAIQCGASKPYTSTPTKNWILNGCYTEKPLYDVCFFSVTPVMAFPVDFTVLYPFVFYEAGHFVSEPMELFETGMKVALMERLILSKGYKRVICIHNGRWTENENSCLTVLMREMENTGVEIVDALSDDVLNTIKEKFSGNMGLVRSRVICSCTMKDHLRTLIPGAENVDFNKTPDKLLEQYKRRIEFNTKYGLLAEDVSGVGFW